MSIFIAFICKIFPMFLCIFFGWLMGKLFKVKKNDIATIFIFIVSPVISFHGAFTLELNRQTLSLPFLFFTLCTIITLLFLWIGKKLWKDNTGNLLAFASSYGNYAAFAIPASISLFGVESESVIIIAGIGFVVYSVTVGYFVTALGNFSIRKSLIKTLSLPMIYAVIIGLILNSMHIKFGVVHEIDFQKIYLDFARDFRGVLTVLGMMLIGIAIAEIKKIVIDWKFLSMTMLAQFVLWPLIIGGLIALDKTFFGFYPSLIHKIMFLLSLIPVGINLIAYSTQLDVHPEKASTVILITTLFALVYIPMMISLFIRYI